MAQYKIVKMNTGFGSAVYTVNRVDGRDLVPVRPAKYYKTKLGAQRKIAQLKKR